jgi:hypothetical protein
MLQTNFTTTNNKIKFCVNGRCGKPLAGKQRSYCSDRCRKAVSRSKKADNLRTNGQQNSPVSSPNSETVNIFSQFADGLSDLSPAGIAQLKLHLLNEAKYSDEWIGRLSHCQHDIHIKEKVSAQQTLSDILWRLVDDLQEIEAVI